MSLTTDTATGAAAGTNVIVDLKGMWIGLAVLNVFYLLVRIYEQVYGWRAGLDSFAPEFQTYWMSILWTEIPLELVSGLGLAGYLWKTRDRNVDAVAPRENLRRLVVLLQWLVVYAVSLYWGASFFTEQDATWHMTVIRDTDFTPSHIIEFYLSYPIYSLMALGGFFYAKTRIPDFAHGYRLAHLIVALGPFMIIPNVGLNEWGHTFWFMEELFVAPLHWGFVFFGWMALGVFGVVLIILVRIHMLIGKEVVALLDGGSTSAAPPRDRFDDFIDRMTQPVHKMTQLVIGYKDSLPRNWFRSYTAKRQSKASDEPPRRNLNAWINETEPKVGKAFEIFVNIGESKRPIFAFARFREPNWGDATSIELLVSLSSRECDVKPSCHELKLPRRGNSETVMFEVETSVAGNHEFSIRVYLAKQMIQLQSLSFTVVVAAAQIQPART